MSFRLRLLAFALSLAVSLASRAHTLPRAEDINKLAQAANVSVETFAKVSAKLRFQYEYSGQFLNPADREKLRECATAASKHLRRTAESQEQLKNQVEEYEGDDWDDRYGSTGLWRKLFADLYTTGVHRCEIDFYAAICARQPIRDETLHEILARIDSLSKSYNTAYLHLLRAKGLALLAQTDPAYKRPAKKEFDGLAERSDMRQSTAFKIAIERIKLLAPPRPDRLDQLTDDFAQSNDANDLQLILSLACLQHRFNRPKALENTVRTWPQTEAMLGSLALADSACRLERQELDLQKISPLEAELAAQAAWRGRCQDYAAVLRRLANDRKFQTPLILYVTAVASAKTSPTEASRLLIKAAAIQKETKGRRLNIEAREIARQAASLICNARAAEQSNHDAVLEIIEDYRRITGGQMAGDLEYCYANALIEAGQKKKGTQLLNKIAETPTASRHHRARLDFIIDKYYARRENTTEISKELLDLLGDCTEQNDPGGVRAEAMHIYCQLLLESQNKTDAQKALDIHTDAEIQNDPNLTVFKSKALHVLDRLDEAAQCLARICEASNREHVHAADLLLIAIIDRIEQLQHDSADPANLVENALTIARYCLRISMSTYGLIPVGRARLYVAELSLLAPSNDGRILSRVEKLLAGVPEDARNNPDYLRCRARLFSRRAKFAEAAGLWAKVAQIHKNRPSSPNRRSANWWRATFYGLHCWSKTPQAQDRDVGHTIEVLESSFAQIPPLWAEKLKSLRTSLRQNR